ncbi:hypothetical protein BN439_2286 [Erwinia amylovora Ea644]|nr:hypothetical protein BN439_2286 [Erwinia amylovora Ea644]CCP07357.1 hypothetical protein BN440_2335 [Erwinia amylovora MR1]
MMMVTGDLQRVDCKSCSLLPYKVQDTVGNKQGYTVA